MGLHLEWRDEAVWTDQFQREWSDLVDRSPHASMFQTPEWLLPWWTHTGGVEPRNLIARRDGRLVAFASFVRRREQVLGFGARTIVLAGAPQADRSGLLHDPADGEALAASARALVEATRTVDMARLSEIEVGAPEEEALRAACSALGLPIASKVCARSPFLRLDRPWDTIESSFSSTLRTRLRRARRRQEKAGGFEFARWQPDPDAVPDLLPHFRDLEDLSWKGTRKLGVFSPANRWEFALDVARRFAARRWLDVATLRRHGRLVAYRFGFRYRGVFLDYNLAHDPNAAEFSPGRTLLDDIIRDSHRIGLVAVDASRGTLFPPHLLADWTSESRWHRNWMIFGPTLRGRALAVVERHAKPLMRRVTRRDVAGLNVMAPKPELRCASITS
jgi:CelD/BcsL family acetyltransferase involved in cellulose biosynthesis